MHELTKTYQIDGKWHVKPSVGTDKGKSLKIFDTEAEANAWSKQRSNNYMPKKKEYKSMIERMSDDQIKKMLKKRKKSLKKIDTKTGDEVKDKPTPVMYGGSMNASSMRKNKGEPVAAMPGYHKQNRNRY